MEKNVFQTIKQNHLVAMIICCAIPLMLIAVLSIWESLGSWGYYSLFFLCPLLHIFMMRGHGLHSNHGKDQQRIQEETSGGTETFKKAVLETEKRKGEVTLTD